MPRIMPDSYDIYNLFYAELIIYFEDDINE